VEIEGFKGIRSLEFEPSGLNLITGRNNTGKTSVLEAVEVALTPSALQKLSDELEYIINSKFEKTSSQLILDSESRSLVIREPSDSEVVNAITSAFRGYLDHNNESSKEFLNEYDLTVDDVESEIANTVSRNIEKFTGCVKMLELDNNIYPWVSLQRDSINIVINSVSEMLEEDKGIEEHGRVPGDETAETELEGNNTVSRSASQLIRIHGYSGFPESVPKQVVAKSISPTQDVDHLRVRKSRNIAIRKDDISDFLKERELVDDLKTFDTDYLVFENEEDGKWQVPYEFMGDGFKTIVGILWELMDDEENDVVLIEEPENHLHPGYVQELIYFLIELAREDDVQLFITTHSADFIGDFFTDAMRPEDREFLEDEFSVLRLEENAAQQLDYEEAEHELKDLHLDLRGI
jgi:AAA15 family ATPase/GTPase